VIFNPGNEAGKLIHVIPTSYAIPCENRCFGPTSTKFAEEPLIRGNSTETHSCGSFSVDQFLASKSNEASDLYRQVEKFILGLGDVRIAPAKTRIGFQNCRIFAAVNRAADWHLDIHIVTFTPIQSERVRRVEQLTPDCAVNHIRIGGVQDLDEELAGWLRQGYEWGAS
jgi:hypothetical protein